MTVTPPTALPAPIVDGITHVNADSVMPNFEALRDGLNAHAHDEYALKGEARVAYTQTWTWTTKTADASQNGQLGVNNADWTLATQLNLSEQAADNTDVTVVLNKVKVGDELYVQHKTDSTRWARYVVTGTPLDQGAWRSFPVSFKAGGGSAPGNNNNTIWSLLTQSSVDFSTVPLLLPADDARNVFSGASGRLLISGKVTGDAQNRFTLDTLGTLRWGPGNAATDASLAYSAGQLNIAATGFNVAAGVGITGRLIVTRPAGNITIDTRATGNANPALSIDTTGKLSWGDGTLAADTALARWGAGVLQFGTTTQKGGLRVYGGSAGDVSLSMLVTTDAQPRFYIRPDGYHAWGDGTATLDCFLFRNGAGELRTTDTMLAVARTSAATLAFSALATGDGQRRFSITAGGSLSWGDGASPVDTSLQRRGAKELGLSDTFLTVQRVNATDLTFRSLLLSGDTVARFQFDVNGSHDWGPGTGATDCRLVRNSPGYMIFTLASALEVSGGAYFIHRGADFTTGFLFQGSTALSVQSPSLVFRDNQSTPKRISIRKSGDQLLAILDDGGNVRVSFDVGSAGRLTTLPGALNLGGDGVSAGILSLQVNGYVSARYATTTGSAVFVAKVTGDAQDRYQQYPDGKQLWGDGTLALDTTLARIGAGLLGLGTTTQKGRLRAFGGATTDVAYDTLVTTDANPRFTIAADGRQEWGPGTGATDAILRRRGASDLATLNTLFTSQQAAATTAAFATVVTNEAQYRLIVRADGVLQWSDGTVVGDTTLSRAAASVLRTDSVLSFLRSTAGAQGLVSRATGDSQDRFTLAMDGTHSWGPGNAVTDCTLFRRNPNELGLTSTLLTSVPLTVSNSVFSTLPSGSAARVFNVLGSGQLQWGDGTAAVDTFFSRISDATHLGLALSSTRTLAAGAADSAALQIAPTVNGAFTLTRLNYIEAKQPAGSSTITDAAVVSFDAVAGTHKAVDAGSTKTTPGSVSAWVKINIAGTIYYLPAYTSKTT